MCAIVWLAATLAVSALAISVERTPPAREVHSDSTEISTTAILEHVASIAAAPHPAGSLANAAVEAYLVDRLRAIGVEPTVQEFPIRAGKRDDASVGRNVIARIAGTVPGHTVAFVAHYDSVATGPGAGDDAVAVGALLEVARLVRAGAPVRNDVLVVFTDAEELGLQGARALVGAAELAPDTTLAFNFDARGTSGPVRLFETNGDDEWMVERFGAAVERPVASSLGSFAFRLLPNDTDFSVFRAAGVRGMNFAFIGGYPRYHTSEDTPANVDPATVRHVGGTALALARSFGDADLGGRTNSATGVYFDLFGRRVVHYGRVVAALLAVLSLAWLGWLVRGARVSRRGVARAATLSAITVVACAVTGLVWWYGVSAVRGWPIGAPPRRVTADFGNVVTAYAAAVAATLAAYVAIRRRASAGDGVAGWLVLLGGLAVATGLAAPATSYLFAWPLVSALAALTIVSRVSMPRALAFVVSFAAFAASLALLAPTLADLTVALAVPFAAVLAPIAACIAALGAIHFDLVALAPGTAPAHRHEALG